MPRITKLEMQGFKSFAKKTQILFPSNFSIIAGPNGSGKSNVLDAIVFVLGRTSAKSIRADKMLEVIFNGSKKSPPAEFASVKMHFDNKDKKFPVEAGEVEINRKVNRKGVSIYKLNSQTVTREKILEVLRAANINPDGHNIILQGDVTNVIEMSDLERREIIDDISGISEFEDKREKANKELMTVEERLDTTSVILGERENQMKKLQEEAKSAVEYNDLAKELDKLRASLAARRLGEAGEAMKILEEKIFEKEKETKTSEAEVFEIDSEMEKTQKEFSTLTEKTISRAGDVSIIKEAEKLRAEIYAKKNKIESSEFDIKRIDEVIARLKDIAERALTESASGAVQAILKLNRTGIYGTIAQLSKVPQNYQTAIEVCAGAHLHDLVVSDSGVAVDCVNYLKQNRVGRATFLPLDKIHERNPEHVRRFLKQPGVIGLAIDLIQFDKKYWHAFSHIFGDTLVVDKIETARRLGIGEARMVTLDGDLVERGGAIIGGFYRSDKKVFSVAEDFSKYEKEKERILRESESLQIEIEKLSRELEKLSQKEQAGGKEVSEMQTARADAEKNLHGLRLKRKEAFEHKLNLGEEINKLKISRARFEAELENIKAEFANYKAELAEYKEMSAGELNTKILKSVSKIQSLGPINQKAVDELEEIKKGFSELKEKFDVLTKERDRVVRMILEIESGRKETFMKTFNAVSQQFKNVYKDLTNGEGFLSLDNELIDEAGLIIEAVPAGKKKINIDSMSGGEKTMVALAFLFALQRFRPSPFYILDEIDAALDKPNAARVVGLIKKYSDNAQFIVISHNETTIQAADCVYGVSMDEGESKMVGIRMPG